MLKKLVSKYKECASNVNRFIDDVSNEFEEIKLSYEREKTESRQKYSKAQYQLQRANKSLRKKTKTNNFLVSEIDDLRARVKSLKSDLKASTLHTKKQHEKICALKSNFSNIASRFQSDLIKNNLHN